MWGYAMPTAVLIDGDFFLRRYRQVYGKKNPLKVAQDLHNMCLMRLILKERARDLYRVFLYDCPPLNKKVHSPITGYASNAGLCRGF